LNKPINEDANEDENEETLEIDLSDLRSHRGSRALDEDEDKDSNFGD